MTKRQGIGRWGEQLAGTFLRERGYQVIDRNARTPYGELDLVVCGPQGLVFVEVKTRTSTSFGFPEEAITSQKRAHLLDAAQAYLQMHPELEGDWRIDVISIQGQPGQGTPQILWFENAVH